MSKAHATMSERLSSNGPSEAGVGRNSGQRNAAARCNHEQGVGSSTSFEVGRRPSQERCWHQRQPSGSNIAPFNFGPSTWPMCGSPRRSLDETSPHSKQRRVAFPTLRPPRLSAVWGTGAVDEAWKTHKPWCPVRGCACGPRWQPSGSNIAPFTLGVFAGVWSTGGEVEHRPIQTGQSCRCHFGRCGRRTRS